MRKILTLSFIAGFALLAGSSAVVAQDDDFLVIPVELFACKYNDGKGAADLDKVNDKWNAWADKEGIDDYSAWVLTPAYYGPDQDFDVIWLGAAKDAVALGKAQDAYMAEKAGLHGAYNETISCDSHANFASIRFKASSKAATPANSVLTFSDCKFKEGANSEALGPAMGEWSAYLTEAGSETTIFHWYPAYGGGGEEFDFKRIQVYQNFADLGADYERFGNGGGYEVNGKLLGHLIDCDSNRAYVAKNIRFVELR